MMHMLSIKKMGRDTLEKAIIVALLFGVIAVFSIINPTLLSVENFHSILLTMVPVALVAIAECTCIMGGYFDMSVGMVASFGGLFTALMLDNGANIVTAVIVGLLIGLLSGAIAGFSVSSLGMNAFITTFALQQIYRGIIYIWTGGLSRNMTGAIYDGYKAIARTKIFGGILQLPILYLVIIYILMALFMKYTRLGRSIYLVGNNQKAAHICGIRVKRIQFFMFMLSGFLAALAGILVCSRTGTVQPFVGELYAFEAIAATIVGGTSMSGGKGNLGTTFIGVLIVYVVKNGLIMAGLADTYQYIAIGVILFLAVFAQTERTKV